MYYSYCTTIRPEECRTHVLHVKLVIPIISEQYQSGRKDAFVAVYTAAVTSEPPSRGIRAHNTLFTQIRMQQDTGIDARETGYLSGTPSDVDNRSYTFARIIHIHVKS